MIKMQLNNVNNDIFNYSYLFYRQEELFNDFGKKTVFFSKSPGEYVLRGVRSTPAPFEYMGNTVRRRTAGARAGIYKGGDASARPSVATLLFDLIVVQLWCIIQYNAALPRVGVFDRMALMWYTP